MSIPRNLQEALNDLKWRMARRALHKNKTWDLIKLPNGKKVVRCKWVFTVKHKADGSVERYKAKFVAKSFTQTYGIDYEETFALVAKMNSIRVLLSIVVFFLSFTRLMHDWKVEVLASFYRCLYSCKLREDGEDKLRWVPSRKGDFEVKSFYRVLSAHGQISFPWKSIWRSKSPPRVAFFAWTATRSKILTLDNLRRRGMVVVNRC
jgi:hypothetical protein